MKTKILNRNFKFTFWTSRISDFYNIPKKFTIEIPVVCPTSPLVEPTNPAKLPNASPLGSRSSILVERIFTMIIGAEIHLIWMIFKFVPNLIDIYFKLSNSSQLNYYYLQGAKHPFSFINFSLIIYIEY